MAQEYKVASYEAMKDLIAQNASIASCKREEILSVYGTTSAYRASLVVEPVILDSDHDYLRKNSSSKKAAAIRSETSRKISEFYNSYEASFPVGKGRETLSGFQDIIINRNFDAALQDAHPDFREFIYALKDPEDQKIIGGINFIAYLPKPDKHGKREPMEGCYASTVHMCYTFLDPEYRSMGLVKNLMTAQDQAVAEYVTSIDPELADRAKQLLVFSEQHIPELMDPVSYMTDSSFATKQEQRLMKWNQLGFRKLNLEDEIYDRYLHPAFGDENNSCDYLSLNAYARHLATDEIVPTSHLTSQTLKHHLHGFFETSMLGEADSCHIHPVAATALKKLNAMQDTTIKTKSYVENLDQIIFNLRRREIRNDFILRNASEDQIHSGLTLQDLRH